MSLMPVHCCCNPSKRIGWVPVPPGSQKLGTIHFVQSGDRRQLWSMRHNQGDQSVVKATVIKTEVALLVTDGASHYAVKSAHVDVAGWRRVSGFVAEGDV